VEFVLNDYLQIRFDGPREGGPIVLNCYVWPTVTTPERTWREPDVGYADAVRRLAPGTVRSTTEATGVGIQLELDTGTVTIHPELKEVYVEIAEIQGFADRAWMVWRPGEDSFEDLIQ
jgi:hypothetical protein